MDMNESITVLATTTFVVADRSGFDRAFPFLFMA
jgi:hypothetical protein